MNLISKIGHEFSFLRGNLLVLIVSWVLMDLVSTVPYTYFSLYIEGLGGTPAIVGVINFVSFIAMASVQFLGGYLADIYGRRWLIVSMTFGVALSNLIFAFAPSWQFVIFATLIQNLCLIYQPALSAITADSIPTKKRGIGFSTIMLISNIASLASPPIAGILFLHYGFLEGTRIGFLIVTAFFLAAAVLRLRLKETLKKAESRERKFKDLLKSYPHAVKESLVVWKFLPRSMFFLFITNTIGSFAYILINPYMVLYATDILKVGGFQWAILLTWFTAVMVLTALPAGKLVDKYGRTKCLLISWLLYLPFPLLFINGNIQLLYLSFLLWGISNALFTPAYSAMEADLVPRELRGKEVGCSQFVIYIFMALGGLLGGFLYEHFSPSMPFLMSFSLASICLIIQILFIREPEKRYQ
ncbi:MFS transporter [Candidatus Bathyarchaeota archaeon]|nr:MAG: MFS transporter [Candidatus Bathyarchaeota archaeon]